MCMLCRKYGTKAILDDRWLATALSEAANAWPEGSSLHIVGLIDAWLGDTTIRDVQADSDWEYAHHDG
jgi:hypothetical protein